MKQAVHHDEDLQAFADATRAKLHAASPTVSYDKASPTTSQTSEATQQTAYAPLPCKTPGGSKVVSAGTLHPLQSGQHLSRTRKFLSERYVIIVVEKKQPVYIPRLNLSFRANVTNRARRQAPPMTNADHARLIAQQHQSGAAPPSVDFVHAPTQNAWGAPVGRPSPVSSSSSAPATPMKRGLWSCISSALHPQPRAAPHKPAWR